MDEARALFIGERSGSLSTVYPSLSDADRDHFGLAVASTRGEVVTSGDADVVFPLMSIAKPFVFALVCDTVGIDEVRRRVGVNATGLAFNSASAVERDPHGRTNPMVNPGAIATTSLVPGVDLEERWHRVREGCRSSLGARSRSTRTLSRRRGRPTIATARWSTCSPASGALQGDPSDAVDIYTRQSSLRSPRSTWR